MPIHDDQQFLEELKTKIDSAFFLFSANRLSVGYRPDQKQLEKEKTESTKKRHRAEEKRELYQSIDADYDHYDPDCQLYESMSNDDKIPIEMQAKMAYKKATTPAPHEFRAPLPDIIETDTTIDFRRRVKLREYAKSMPPAKKPRL